MTATVDSLLDEYQRRYTERDAVREHFASAIQAYRFTGVVTWRRSKPTLANLARAACSYP